jgi:hypothetical protein
MIDRLIGFIFIELMKGNIVERYHLRLITVALLGLFFLGMLSACGKDGGSSGGSGGNASPGLSCSTLTGNYYEQSNPSVTLAVSNACTFTDSVCGYNATYTVPNETTGATTVTIIGTNGAPGCLSSTAHACSVAYNGVQLVLDCGSPHQYLFIRQ